MSEVSEKKIDQESEDINLNENDDHCAETVVDTNADDETSQVEVDGRKISEEDSDESSVEDQEIPNDLVDERVDELEKELLEVNSTIFEMHFLCLSNDFGVITIKGFLNSLCICLLKT